MTVEEARAITKDRDTKLATYIKQCDAVIEKFAKEGKRTFRIGYYLPEYNREYSDDIVEHYTGEGFKITFYCGCDTDPVIHW